MPALRIPSSVEPRHVLPFAVDARERSAREGLAAEGLAAEGGERSAESGGMTLREAWGQYCEPLMRGRRAESTILGDRYVLGRKTSGLFEKNLRTANPEVLIGDVPLADLDHQKIAEIQRKMAGLGLSAGTINKEFRTIRKILRAAHQDGQISRLPRIENLPQTKHRPRTVTCDEVGRMYAAADAAEWPRIGERSPGDFWRTLLVGYWTYGFRTQDLACYKSAAFMGLLWSAVILSADCGIAGATITSPHGWLHYQPQKTARTRGELLLFPLSKCFRRHLDPWVGADTERVLPNGRNRRYFARAWNAIRSAAGVDDSASISGGGRGGTVRSIRKGCCNNWDRSSGRRLGRWVLGHSPVGTTDNYYTDVLPDLVEWIDRIELPKVFG